MISLFIVGFVVFIIGAVSCTYGHDRDNDELFIAGEFILLVSGILIGVSISNMVGM